MHLKDYYQILELEPSATIPEIKKSFRVLAQKYHPDKNNNDPYASIHFASIKEAYDVLTNPSKKAFYLQQRWYNKSTGNSNTQPIITPVIVLKQALKLERHVSSLDVYRMDKEGLFQFILSQFDNKVLTTLKHYDEKEINHQIIVTILKTMQDISHEQVNIIALQLSILAGENAKTQAAIDIFLQKHTHRKNENSKSIIIVILLTILICLLIWFSML